MVSKDHELSQRRQCTLLQLSRLTRYYLPKGGSVENLRFMAIIDKQFLDTSWYGSRQMARHMKRQCHKCGGHRVRRLMRLMRLLQIYQEPNTSKKHLAHNIPTCSRGWRSTGLTRSGAPTSPISGWSVGSCIW